jgi:uncharacterized protein YndB with AHSA1/START domain
MLNFGITIDVSKRQLWEAITFTEVRGKWWAPGLVLEPQLGGQFRDEWHDGVEQQRAEGVVEECFPSDLLSFTWHEQSWPQGAESKVTFVLEANGLKARLGIRHEPRAGFSQAEWKSIRQGFAVAWSELLFSLRHHLHRCDAQSSHDLVIRAKLAVPAKEAYGALLEHSFFADAEILLREESGRAVLAWKTNGAHPVLETRGSTLVSIDVQSEGKHASSVRIVHTGFGFSAEWIAAREWQDMAWTKFLDAIKEDL